MDNRDKPAVSKKGIWSWMLFDWAAQPFHTLILTFIFAPYFASQVAPDPVTGQAQWGYAVALGGIIIAIMSPIFGAISDATGPRKPWIAGFSVLAIIGAFLLWNVVPSGATEPAVMLALTAFVIALFGFEFAGVFINAMMPDLVSREKLGRLSGNAWALGYVAGLLTLIIVLLTMTTNDTGKTLIGIEPLFGLDAGQKEGERAVGPLTAVWYLVFVIPLFLFTPDIGKRTSTAGAVSKGLHDLAETLKRLPSNTSLFAYLGSAMFYRDALNGLYTFGGIYAAGVLGWSLTQIGIFGILANITGIFGAFIGGRVDERYGPKAVVTSGILLLILASGTVVSTSQTSVLFLDLGEGSGIPDIVFYICGGLIGAAGGALQAASRTLMADQAEPGRMTEAFGLYALSGKATAFLAPALVGFFTDISGSQRFGVLPIVILFMVGLALLPFVKQKLPRQEQASIG